MSKKNTKRKSILYIQTHAHHSNTTTIVNNNNKLYGKAGVKKYPLIHVHHHTTTIIITFINITIPFYLNCLHIHQPFTSHHSRYYCFCFRFCFYCHSYYLLYPYCYALLTLITKQWVGVKVPLTTANKAQ